MGREDYPKPGDWLAAAGMILLLGALMLLLGTSR